MPSEAEQLANLVGLYFGKQNIFNKSVLEILVVNRVLPPAGAREVIQKLELDQGLKDHLKRRINAIALASRGNKPKKKRNNGTS